MIEMRNVSKWYGDFQVLKHCTTHVEKGEVVVVCGPSGSGKSTLIKCVNGLEPFQEGAVTVDGTSVGDTATNLSKLRSKIGMVFQNFELFPHITVVAQHQPGAGQGARPERGRGDDAVAEPARRASGSPTRRTNTPRSCPAASSSVSPSPERWRWTRSPCCSTSRPPRSIRR